MSPPLVSLRVITPGPRVEETRAAGGIKSATAAKDVGPLEGHRRESLGNVATYYVPSRIQAVVPLSLCNDDGTIQQVVERLARPWARRKRRHMSHFTSQTSPSDYYFNLKAQGASAPRNVRS